MVFSSIIFLFFFLPVVLVLYYTVCAPSVAMRNGLLLLTSLFFYAWGEPKNVLLLIGSCVLNWGIALAISRWRRYGKLLLVLDCAANLGVLFVFKYLGFAVTNLKAVLGDSFLPQVDIALPIGISFFTFQALSYVIDVYRDTVRVQKNPFYVALYIALFPQLVAGPIVRYSTVAEEIRNRVHSWELLSEGACRFVQGLAKKLLLANTFAVVADNIYSLTEAGHQLVKIPVTLAWLGSFAYTLQIFFDFSGYSDMAIGLGKMFGFHFEENFNYPYISKSVSEFWRRWHISLSTWFREYVYFPLGGSRVENKDKMVRNLLVVWLLTGLWHGANWTFVFWGLFNFVCLLLERLFLFEKWKAHPVWKHLYTMLMVNFGWVLFRSESFYQFQEYLGNMFGLNGNGFFSGQALMFLQEYAVYWVIGILLCLPTAGWLKKKLASLPKLSKTSFAVVYPVGMAGLFFVCVTYLVRSGYNPFIYFNF